MRPDTCRFAPPSARTWRRVTVWLHILTSVGWMSPAVVLAVALTFAAGTDDHELRRGVLAVAHHLDGVLLAPLAVGSALTGSHARRRHPVRVLTPLVGHRESS